MAGWLGPGVSATAFDYSNSSGRPSGPVISLAGRFLAGVREVQTHVEPYARAWEKHNRVALERRDADGGPLWVTLGDSMAQGIGASAYDKGWAGQLAGLIDPAYHHVNLSVSGGRVEDLLERQIPTMGQLGTPDLVTVIIGSNDLFSRQHRRELPERAARLIAHLPVGTVVATQPGRSPQTIDFNHQLEAARQLVLCEFRDPRMRSWAGKLAKDHFHPNDRGYAAMATLMAEAVARRDA